MRKSTEIFGCAVLFVLLVPCCAQTFKGHQIGETFADFLKVEPAIQHKFDYCRTSAPHQLTPEEVAKLSPEQRISRYGTATKSLNKYLEMESRYAKPGSVSPIYFKQLQEWMQTCESALSLAAIYTKGEGEIDSLNADSDSDYNRRFVFENGHLVKFSLDIIAGFDEIKDDISVRIGAKPIETSDPYQNGFGAKWNDHTASWDNDRIHVELFLSDNPARDTARPRVLVESQQLRKKVLGIQKNAPNPLD